MYLLSLMVCAFKFILMTPQALSLSISLLTWHPPNHWRFQMVSQKWQAGRSFLHMPSFVPFYAFWIILLKLLLLLFWTYGLNTAQPYLWYTLLSWDTKWISIMDTMEPNCLPNFGWSLKICDLETCPERREFNFILLCILTRQWWQPISIRSSKP